jgi:outer membrane lipoprotein LolB
LIRKFFPVLLALLLAACAASPPLPPRPSAAAIAAFAFSGRLAVRQGEARHHVRIDWRHAATGDEVLLTTPLGQGVAEILRDAAGARLKLADGRQFAAADWDALSAEVFGFRLPLDASVRWLLDEPRDAEGWRVNVLERENEQPDALPTLIEFERDDIAVRLKIDEWSEVR